MLAGLRHSATPVEAPPKVKTSAQSHATFRVIASILIGSALLTVKSGFECHSTLQLAHFDVPFLPSLLRATVVWYWWAGVAVVLWLAGIAAPRLITFTKPIVVMHVIVGCVLAGLHMGLLRLTMIVLSAHWPRWGLFFVPFGNYNSDRFWLDLTIYGFIVVSASLLRSQTEARLAHMHKSDLERQLSQAQLQALQMQLEPHFLFNTLNSIASLVDLHQNAEASEALTHLNSILSTALERGTPAKVPFREELRAVESYLAIQKMRFGDRLDVHIQTSPEALDGLVPSFLLQPIVENAIQHGLSSMKRGGVLETTACRVDDKLQLRVRDNGAPSTSPTTGHGIGLANTRERLGFFYPKMHQFLAGRRASGGFEVFIEIPFEGSTA